MKHLTRNVCDGCAVWCQFDPSDWSQPRDFGKDDIDHYADGYTSDPAEVECVECLKAAAEYGGECRMRLFKMEPASRPADPPPSGIFTWSESGEKSWPVPVKDCGCCPGMCCHDCCELKCGEGTTS